MKEEFLNKMKEIRYGLAANDAVEMLNKAL